MEGHFLQHHQTNNLMAQGTNLMLKELRRVIGHRKRQFIQRRLNRISHTRVLMDIINKLGSVIQQVTLDPLEIGVAVI
jgi:hypothetical protein